MNTINNKKALCLIAGFCFVLNSLAQVMDSVHKPPTKKDRIFIKKFLAPVALIGLGFYGITDNSIINHDEIKEERNEYFAGFSNKADNYLQFTPIAVVYAMDALALKGVHNWQQQTLLMGTAQVIMMGFITPLKKYTHILRPDSSAFNSFPSGHTAEAFLAATFFYEEYGRQYPWLCAGMFSLAAGIGVMRILNNRHWISDVLAGAGFGMASVELSYLLLKNKMKHPNKHTAFIFPSYKNGVIACTAIIKL